MTSIQLLGMAAGSISAITFLPQVIKTWRTKSAGDISLLMFSFATISVLMWLAYGLILRDIPIIYTNSLVLVCSLVMVYFKFRFRERAEPRIGHRSVGEAAESAPARRRDTAAPLP